MTMKSISSTIDLSGIWKFAIGDAPSPAQAPALDKTLHLPGSLQEQGFGDDVSVDTKWVGRFQDRTWYTSKRYARYREPGNIKIPFWLQPEKHFIGIAWYQREIEVPAEWYGRRLLLTLERAHIQTTLWLDDIKIGSQNTLGAPHSYDLGVKVKPGKHLLTLQVDNDQTRVDVGNDSHSVSDHTQTNWNGVIGRIELSATSPVWIEEAQIYTDVPARKVRIRTTIGNATGLSGKGVLSAGGVEMNVQWNAERTEAEIIVPLSADAGLWDEFNPVLHHLTLQLRGDGVDDSRKLTFGLRELGVNGTQLTVNGRKIFLRGTLECAVFPKTGYPSTDPAEWRRIFSVCRDYGFNHVRFHSWCPPEAAFAVADEMGIYLQVECSAWVNDSVELGAGAPVDKWLYLEGHAIIKAFGNHPSFILMAYGNEPSGEHHRDYLIQWVNYWKKNEPRRLHTSGAGWPSIPENDYDSTPEPRVENWGDRLTSPINFLPPTTVADYGLYVNETPRPIVSHEIGQWCVYPDFSEIPKYTGLLKAKNFEIFRDTLQANHMGDQARDFLNASGKLQVICYREDIESAFRTKSFGGFQVLGATDFPGQGTALVGWLNPFWESKGYVSPKEFRRFNNSTVLLARLERRVFNSRDTLRADIEVSHFEACPTENARPYWKLQDDNGKVYASGELPAKTLPVDNGIELGSIEVPLRDLPTPAKYRLVVGLTGTEFENDWEIWVYPFKGTSRPRPGQDVLLVRDWEVVLHHSERDSKVFFLPPVGVFRNKIGLSFSTIFWNTSWTKNITPHTLGVLCDPKHPALAEFPTDPHTNWQWWELLYGASPLVFDHLPPEVRPIIQVVDDWFTNRRLGLLFEARIGKCRVMVSGMELLGSMHLRHAARQMRQSVVNYMASPKFDPQYQIDQVSLGQVLGHPNAIGRGALPIAGEEILP